MLKFPGRKIFTLSAYFVFSMAFHSFAFANDAPPAASHDAGGENAEKKDDHGEKKERNNIDLPPWAEIQNRLSVLEAKIQVKQENIEKMILAKQHLDAKSPKVKEIVIDLLREHKELQKLSQDYEKEMTVYKFRFPEKGTKGKRNYENTEVKSLDEIEKSLNIDGRLSRNVKKLRSQFGDDDMAKKKEESKKPEEPKEKSIEEAGSIIIRK